MAPGGKRYADSGNIPGAYDKYYSYSGNTEQYEWIVHCSYFLYNYDFNDLDIHCIQTGLQGEEINSGMRIVGTKN